LQKILAKITAYIELARPLNLLQGSISAIISALIMDSLPSVEKILIATGIIVLFMAAGNSLNDYCDYKIDKINRPSRPIPSGRVKKTEALTLSCILFISSTSLSTIIMNRRIFMIILITLISLIGYSLLFKKLPIIGNIVVSFILGLAFIFSTEVYGDYHKGIIPFFLTFFFTIAREIIKDMEDVEGDTKVGARTLPAILGLKKSSKIVTITLSLLIITIFYPRFSNIYGKYYIITIILFVLPAIIYTIISININFSSKNCRKLQTLLKYDIFFGLIAIYVGKF